MKKILSVCIIGLFLLTTISSIAVAESKIQEETEGWTGFVRIEGKEETIWAGTVTVVDTSFEAVNVDTGLNETYNISYPSVLGTLIKAAEIGGFSYLIEYYPAWSAFIVTTIEDDFNWWLYWVDYEQSWVGSDAFELTNDHNEILWGYLETTPPDYIAHALKINLESADIIKNMDFKVNVLDENDTGVVGATVKVGDQTILTDENGTATIKISKPGTYDIYVEKEGYVRSEQLTIQVKTLLEFLIEKIIEFIKNIIN